MEYPYLRDKSWMYVDARRRTEPLFEYGVYFFINFAYTRLGYSLETEILCPCSRYMNLRLHQKDIGWIETHRGKDQASILYREQVLEKAAGMEIGPDSPLTVIAPILDSISGGHHGGYERGIGSGGHRRYMTTPVIHDYAMTQTQREATIQREVKVKQLESSLDVEIRAREEQASMFTAQASKLAEQMAEMERRLPGRAGKVECTNGGDASIHVRIF